MPFFTSESDKHKDWATRVWNVSLRVFKKISGAKLDSWHKEFARLEKKYGEEIVEKVVSWYEDDTKNKDFHVKTASAFRKAFPQLSDKAWEKETPIKVASFVHITEMEWPAEIGSNLAWIWETSSVRWNTFLEKTKPFFHKDRRWASFLTSIWMPPHVFMSNWFELLHRKYGKWKNCVVPLEHLAFDPKSELFQTSFWKRWSFQRTGRYDAFDSLLKAILES